ncbi:MAG: hypothetical protein QNK20_15105 [Aureibaculum sp.]|nr:hypothetical protein [Aureibaculum sp.]
MVYKIRLILDTKENVLRDIVISYNDTLEDLHNAITNAFGFYGTEMASFYLTDDKWNQGDEIPLFDMSESNNSMSMQTFKIKEVLTEDNDKLIYVYDFLALWSFYVELISIEEDENLIELPSLLLSVGVVPNEAPEKEFVSEESNSDSEEYDRLENFDDFDFDNFDELIN